jgi:hypothetical protein
MARARTAKHPEPDISASPSPDQKITKAQAVRDALADGLDGLDDIVNFAKTRYGLEITKQQASIYKSKEKMKGAASPQPGRKPKAAVEGNLAPPKAKSRDEADLIDALETLKPLIAQFGVEKVKRLVDVIG